MPGGSEVLVEHVLAEDHAIAAQEDTWQAGKPLKVEYRMRRQDGREVWMRDELVILRDAATGKRLTRGLLIDITERHHLEEQPPDNLTPQDLGSKDTQGLFNVTGFRIPVVVVSPWVKGANRRPLANRQHLDFEAD